MDTEKIANIAASACDEKQGLDIVILDIRNRDAFSDFFVICSGNSSRHVKAIAENVIEKFDRDKIKYHHVEGTAESGWILLDAGGVVIHVFYYEYRKFYALERLWSGAKEIKIN